VPFALAVGGAKWVGAPQAMHRIQCFDLVMLDVVLTLVCFAPCLCTPRVSMLTVVDFVVLCSAESACAFVSH
jgi:hypothetical protein